MTTKTIKRRSRAKLDIRAAVRAWLLNDDAVKRFGQAKEEGRVLLLDTLKDEGEQDDKGSYWMRFPDDPIEGRINSIKAERRVTKTLDSEAAEIYLRKRKLYNQCTETVVTLDEGKILALAFAGKIPDEDLDALYTVNETFAFIPGRVKL